MEILLHVANVIYLGSYSVRDILWLRIFTVGAASLLIAFFYLRPEPLLTAIYWNLLFISLNIFWISRLLWERRPIQLSHREEKLCRLVFHTISPRDMIRILKMGEWRTAEAGDCFVAREAPLDSLMVIYSGLASEVVGELVPGQFIGSISFITDEASPADFVALYTTYYIVWPKERLKRHLEKDPELRAAIQVTLSRDLTDRVRASWNRIRNGGS
jgi:hypothetical protein